MNEEIFEAIFMAFGALLFLLAVSLLLGYEKELQTGQNLLYDRIQSNSVSISEVWKGEE